MNKNINEITNKTNSLDKSKSALSKVLNKHNNNLFKSCINCLYSNTCTPYVTCDFLTPHPSKNSCIEKRIEEIRMKSSPIPYRRMHKGLKIKDITAIDIDPIYQYQVGIINDCLSDIRSGGIGYLYTEQSLHDLFSIEPNAVVTFYDGIYYISLQGGQNIESDNIIK